MSCRCGNSSGSARRNRHRQDCCRREDEQARVGDSRHRLRAAGADAFKGKVDGQLRYWREGMLGDDPARMIEELGYRGAEVVALGPGIPPKAALQLARAIDHDRPDISTVIVAQPSTDLLQSALHAGARDVIAPDAPANELRAAFERVLHAASARRSAFEAEDKPVDATQVILTMCPKGGAGKTTMATNLAIGLARIAPGCRDRRPRPPVRRRRQRARHCARGDVHRRHSVTRQARRDHAQSEPRRAFVGLYVLCAPLTPTEADDVTSEQIDKVLKLLIESFKYVVIDTASGLDEHTLAALEFATDLILISATDVPSIRSTQKEIDALRVIGNPDHRWHFVLNRADARTGLTIAAIETAVGINVDVAIPSSRAVPLSLNRGMPVIESDPRAPVSLAMSQLVRRIAPNAHRTNSIKNGSTFWRKNR